MDSVNNALANEVSTLNLSTGQFHKGQIVVDELGIITADSAQIDAGNIEFGNYIHEIKSEPGMKANVTDRKVQNLAAYVNVGSLREIHRTMDKNKASGIDKVTKEEYGQNLEENLVDLVERMKNDSYRPNPTRRVYIPKETKGKMRPLGISSYEDKLVENAITQILEQIYEPKFYDEIYGFRPNRNCHQAVREIIEMVQYRKTNYVVEADSRGIT